jgi:hypothetical protein
MALGECEGDMSSLKQDHGDLSRDLEISKRKLKAAASTLKKYEESSDREVQLQVILSQVLSLREQSTGQHQQLSEQVAEGNQSLTNNIVGQGHHPSCCGCSVQRDCCQTRQD